MLPGPHCLGIADPGLLAAAHSAHDVRDQAVLAPVPAANDIAGSGAGHQGLVALPECLGLEVGAAVSTDYQLRAGLGGAVGINPAQGILLSAGLLRMLITLVAADTEHCPYRVHTAAGLQDMGGAQDIAAQGLQGKAIAVANQGLGSQMQDQLWLEPTQDLEHTFKIADIRYPGIYIWGTQGVVRRLCPRLQTQAADPGPQPAQPEAEPGALESGVPGNQNPPAGIGIAKHHQTFHSARPCCHIRFKASTSRRVSMQYQKPSCL